MDRKFSSPAEAAAAAAVFIGRQYEQMERIMALIEGGQAILPDAAREPSLAGVLLNEAFEAAGDMENLNAADAAVKHITGHVMSKPVFDPAALSASELAQAAHYALGCWPADIVAMAYATAGQIEWLSDVFDMLEKGLFDLSSGPDSLTQKMRLERLAALGRHLADAAAHSESCFHERMQAAHENATLAGSDHE